MYGNYDQQAGWQSLLDKLKCFKDDTIYFGVGAGWFGIISELMLEIDVIAHEAGLLIEVLQIKEKFGGLRFYTNIIDDNPSLASQEARMKIDKLIDDAEVRSIATCEVCGEAGTRSGRFWVKTLCSKHSEEQHQRELLLARGKSAG